MQSHSVLRVYPKGQRPEFTKLGYSGNIGSFIGVASRGSLPVFYTPRTTGLSDVTSIKLKKIQTIDSVSAKIDPETRDVTFESETVVSSPAEKILRTGEFLYSLGDKSVNVLEGYYVVEFSDGTNEFETDAFLYLEPLVSCSNFTAPTPLIAGISNDFTLDITNNGDTDEPYDITMTLEGNSDNQTGTIASGATVQLTFSITAPTDGNYTISWSGTCDGSSSVTVQAAMVFDINVTDSATQNTGVTLNFASGSVYGKYDDESTGFTFTNGVEDIRTYASNGTRKLYIAGDFANVTGITADSARLTSVDVQAWSANGTLDLGGNSSLSSLILASSGNGTFTNLILNGCAFTSINLQDAKISGSINLSNNTSLSNFTIAASGHGALTSFLAPNCAFSSIDLKDALISGIVDIYDNTSLSTFTIAASGHGLLTRFRAYNCAFTSIDLKDATISSVVNISDNASLNTFTFNSTGNGRLVNFSANGCNFTSINLQDATIENRLYLFDNTSLSTFTIVASGHGQLSDARLYNCAFTGIDLKDATINSRFDVSDNTGLTTINYAASGHGTINNYLAYNCALSASIDFTNITVGAAANIRFDDNSWSDTIVNNQLTNLDTNTSGIYTGIIEVNGTNAAPTGAGLTAKSNLQGKGFTVNTN